MPKAARLTDSERRAWLAKCWVTWCDVGFGCRLYLAFHPGVRRPHRDRLDDRLGRCCADV